MLRPNTQACRWLPGLLLCLGTVLHPALAAPTLDTLRGELSVHDPSTIVKCGNEFWLFATGRGIISRRSSNLEEWQEGPRVFREPPPWTTNAVPGFRGHFWAPDLIQIGNRFLLYYSVSTWGSQTSAIGLATNSTLNPEDPSYEWKDQGIVLQTSPRDDFNAIDPSVLLDRDGRLWMAVGSYWSGIKILELDPRTGTRMEPGKPPKPVAWKEAIEAAALHRRGDYYYLFVNWGQCCRGTNSTYNIRVGRSPSVTGPYIDKDGQDLLCGGGSLLLQSNGRFIGPGHPAFLNWRGSEFISYHFYDGDRHGAKTLGIRPFGWDAAGWPVIVQ